MDKCEEHNNQDFIVACFYPGCPKRFLCHLCCRKHSSSHDKDVVAIKALEADPNWCNNAETTRKNTISKVQEIKEEDNRLFESNFRKINETATALTQTIQEIAVPWSEDLERYVGGNSQNECLRELWSHLSNLEALCFEDENIYITVPKVKEFNDKQIPRIKDLMVQASRFLNESTINEESIEKYKTQLSNILKATSFANLLNSGQFLGFEADRPENKKLLDKIVELTKENDMLRLQNAQLSGRSMSSKPAPSITAETPQPQVKPAHNEDTFGERYEEEPSAFLTEENLAQIDRFLPRSLHKDNWKLRLVYRGLRDGFNAEACHRRIGNSLPLLIVIQSERVFGAYVTKKLAGELDSFETDANAFLFSLTHNEKYACKDATKAISREEGAIFSFGVDDLMIAEDADQNNNSSAKFTKYERPTSALYKTEGKRYLAGSEKFSVREIEVYEVV